MIWVSIPLRMVYQCLHQFPWAIKLVQTCPRSEVLLDHASTCMPPNAISRMLKTRLWQALIHEMSQPTHLHSQVTVTTYESTQSNATTRIDCFTKENWHLVTQCTEALGMMKTPDMHSATNPKKSANRLHGKSSNEICHMEMVQSATPIGLYEPCTHLSFDSCTIPDGTIASNPRSFCA